VKHKTPIHILATERDDVGQRRLLHEQDLEGLALQRIKESVKDLEDELGRMLQFQKTGRFPLSAGALAQNKSQLGEKYEMLLERLDSKRETIAEINGCLTMTKQKLW